MRQSYPYLSDPSFLMGFTKNKNTDLFIKIIILTMNEKPIKEIQGRVLSGSINVDGNSAVRRTGNLSIFIEENDASYMEIGGLFSLNKKIKIEVGLLNNSEYYQEYPILWFPQGTYAIINLSSSYGTSGTTVNLQIKDKMVYLNGECGGMLSASVVFDEYEVLNPETGEYAIEKPVIPQIITELVNHFGGESLDKIIISDIDNRVKKVMKWTQNNYLYYYDRGKNENGQDDKLFTLIPFNENHSQLKKDLEKQLKEEIAEYEKIKTKQEENKEYTEEEWLTIKKEHEENKKILQEQIDKEQARIKAGPNHIETDQELAEKIKSYKVYSYGDDVGYIYSDFYFPRELVGNAGDSVCTILDSIKNTLGNFEYFYDLDGNFRFQEIKNYLNTTQATNALNSEDPTNYLVDRTKGKAAYVFNDSEIITSFSNSPQYANVKNDFVVWGMRESVDGKTLPIRYHLAIDSKPKVGNTYKFHFFPDPEAINLEDLQPIQKARLAIEVDSASNFPDVGTVGRVYYSEETGIGYYWDADKITYLTKEQVDSKKYPPAEEVKVPDPTVTPEEFLNQIPNGTYDTSGEKIKENFDTLTGDAATEEIYKGEELQTTINVDCKPKDGIEDFKYEYHSYYHETEVKEITTTDWREELYFSGINTSRFGNDSNYYYTELENEWTKLFDYDRKDEAGNNLSPTWKDSVINNPSGLDYFLDFIDSNAKVSEFSISNIGRRTHIVSDDSINCIFEPEIPNYVLIEADGDNSDFIYECQYRNQPWISVDSTIWAGLAQGGSHNSAFNMIQDLLYQYTGYNESITLETLPMYFLEPNIRITARNEETGIYGDYMLSNFSVPLDVNGTMSLSCTRALERI